METWPDDDDDNDNSNEHEIQINTKILVHIEIYSESLRSRSCVANDLRLT